ncbi:MAG: SAM-dependent methyltransferase [Deferrisomatales bacterium]|nr:SAM-dependent methyltransferase [Deferrisomatales bacterium]
MDTSLHRWISARLEATGPVPFARFMEWCLYHPEYGYYTAGRVRVGDDAGDFTTSPHVSTVFAACVARFVTTLDRALGHPPAFTLIEGGPGEGRLAGDLLDTLARREPGLYGRVAYHLDEISPALRERQHRALEGHSERVRSGLPQHRVTGLYLSNELVDALPVNRFIRRGEELLEVWVEWDGKGLHEVLRPPADPAVAAMAEALDPADGCLVEVRPGAGPWLERAAACLERGAIVTVDYGDAAHRLFGPHRPGGTCVGYRGHHQSAELLAAPGEQDLTAQVDFTDLARRGERLGLVNAPLRKQREFLFAAGLLAELEELEASDRTDLEKLQLRQAVAPLLMPGAGMGDAFKVLVQTKGVEEPF